MIDGSWRGFRQLGRLRPRRLPPSLTRRLPRLTRTSAEHHCPLYPSVRCRRTRRRRRPAAVRACWRRSTRRAPRSLPAVHGARAMVRAPASTWPAPGCCSCRSVRYVGQRQRRHASDARPVVSFAARQTCGALDGLSPALPRCRRPPTGVRHVASSWSSDAVRPAAIVRPVRVEVDRRRPGRRVDSQASAGSRRRDAGAAKPGAMSRPAAIRADPTTAVSRTRRADKVWKDIASTPVSSGTLGPDANSPPASGGRTACCQLVATQDPGPGATLYG